jgi:hypothetical protein
VPLGRPLKCEHWVAESGGGGGYCECHTCETCVEKLYTKSEKFMQIQNHKYLIEAEV